MVLDIAAHSKSIWEHKLNQIGLKKIQNDMNLGKLLGGSGSEKSWGEYNQNIFCEILKKKIF